MVRIPETKRQMKNSRKLNLGHAPVISYEVLEKATNNFTTELGGGAFGKVYLGELDGQQVAVKVLFDRSSARILQYFNEVSLFSRIRHPNLVKLYGCTNPHGVELLLVYEYVSNGTIEDHLRGNRPTLPWATRMDIAIETAEALGYLHSLEPLIVHRDVKSANILLDGDFHVKVADLGMSRLLPWDTTQVTTVAQGTVGYRDPEYDQTGILSDRSDVYSFGVLLVELISGLQVVDVERDSDVFLPDFGLRKIVDNKLEEFVDKGLEYHSSDVVKRMIHLVAELARECMQPKGYMRPRMVEVVTTLKRIRDGLLELHDEPLEEASAVGRFTHEELQEATNSFDPLREISYGGLDKVYLGKFRSKLAVAVKLLTDQNLEQLKRMINEVTLISKNPHKNLLTLYGYTNESTPNMLLVYEYVPNGTVADHLHGKRLALTWSQRIQIATETAEGLVHLHSLKPPVIHRYVKTSNILLDNALHVKVSGLGMHHICTASGHMLGYQDPLFDRTHMFTEKSDVYSFGVFLVELICGKQAVDVNPDTGEFRLVSMAMSKIVNEELEMLVDPKLHYQSDSKVTKIVNSVAELACSCLRLKLKMRPSMVEVHMVLMMIKGDLDIIQEKFNIDAGLLSITEEETTVLKDHYTPERVLARNEKEKRTPLVGEACDLTEQRWQKPWRAFSLEELRNATNNFSIDNCLGQGVFRGRLWDGSQIVVKRLDIWIDKGEMEFVAQVEASARLRHKNLQNLLGYCAEGQERLTVYEYMPNRNLASRLLVGSSLKPQLDWSRRMRIAIGIAEGIAYLHHQATPYIIHRNIKTSNVLLDSDFEAHVADFEFAMLIPARRQQVDEIMYDCRAPELKYVDATKSSDVYSFGIVLLQLATGKDARETMDPRDNQTIINWALRLVKERRYAEITDPKLNGQFVQEELERVVLVSIFCAQWRLENRPTMLEVVELLKGESKEKLTTLQNHEMFRTNLTECYPGIYQYYHGLDLRQHKVRSLLTTKNPDRRIVGFRLAGERTLSSCESSERHK